MPTKKTRGRTKKTKSSSARPRKRSTKRSAASASKRTTKRSAMGRGSMEQMTKDELYAKARSQDIEGRSGMSKSELIRALSR